MVVKMVKINLQYKNPNGKGYKHETFSVDFLNTKGFCIFTTYRDEMVLVIGKETNVELTFGVNWIQATITDNMNLI